MVLLVTTNTLYVVVWAWHGHCLYPGSSLRILWDAGVKLDAGDRSASGLAEH